MLFIIFISTIVVSLDNPTNDPNENKSIILNYIDTSIGVIYLLEIIINSIAFGFIIGPNSYLRKSFWNIFDFLIVIVSIFQIYFREGNFFSTIKVLRCLRVLKMSERHEGLKLVLTSLINVFPSILKLLLLFLICIMSFGLFAIQYLKGKFYYCINYDIEFFKLIVNKYDCFDYGGDWINKDNNFDNILNASLTLFKIATSEGWSGIMYKKLYIKYLFN